MTATVVLARIDDRLVHGQVAVGWVKAVQPDVLLVANDAASRDPIQKSLMELAAPPPLQVIVCSVSEAAAALDRPTLKGKRVLLLFASPQDVWRLVEAGVPLRRINVGGLRYQPGKRQLMKAVAMDADEAKIFAALLNRGLQVSIQMVPTDEPVDIRKYLP